MRAPGPDCPVARTLDLVGDRWSLLVMRNAPLPAQAEAVAGEDQGDQ
ncbi:winged helix-turn-helix transcriptional regulator [Sinosporangium siamense]|nr:hypothetical protein [Sinosporangium siamense]